MMKALTWIEFLKLPPGTRLGFASDWDMFPEALVKAGTRGIVVSHDEMWTDSPIALLGARYVG
jgi:hypothetical protein